SSITEVPSSHSRPISTRNENYAVVPENLHQDHYTFEQNLLWGGRGGSMLLWSVK
ncbi:hypothetical protein L9F63_002279, partial [Diploptera punctata]